jgi:acyl-CoA thioester hydrolase
MYDADEKGTWPDMAISTEIEIKAPFYDVDSMGVVYHGNYVKYLEDARCALLEKIGYDYTAMLESGYAWPVVGINIKYISPISFKQVVKVCVALIEYEHCIKMKYTLSDAKTGKKIAKAETTQMAINMDTMEALYFSPQILLDKVREHLENA